MAEPINVSNLPTVRTFKFEDYPGAEQWFAQFLRSLNLFTDQTYQILNGGVNNQNLVAPRTYAATITTPASGDVTFNFTNPLRIQPTNILIGNIYEAGQPTAHPTDATSVYWHISQNVIYVDNIPNLSTSTSYVISLVVF